MNHTDDNVIPFQVNFSEIESIKIEDIINSMTTEGIDVKPNNDENDPGGRVTYNPSHNDGVDSSPDHNPTSTDVNVSTVQLNPNYVKIYAIMQRVELKHSTIGSDGNPLLYALKNEKGYRFDSKEDENLIRKDIHDILEKFVDQYFSSIKGNVATVIIPSGNTLNKSFAGMFQDVVKERGKTVKIYSDILDKVDTDVIRDEVIDDSRSEFNMWIGQMQPEKARKIKQKLLNYLNDMDRIHNGTFSYHFVRDSEIRNHMSLSMKMSKTPSIANEYGDINDCHVILLDDSVSRGSSIKEAYNLLIKYYNPKSVTGLVLFSPNRR